MGNSCQTRIVTLHCHLPGGTACCCIFSCWGRCDAKGDRKVTVLSLMMPSPGHILWGLPVLAVTWSRKRAEAKIVLLPARPVPAKRTMIIVPVIWLAGNQVELKVRLARGRRGKPSSLLLLFSWDRFFSPHDFDCETHNLKTSAFIR